MSSNHLTVCLTNPSLSGNASFTSRGPDFATTASFSVSALAFGFVTTVWGLAVSWTAFLSTGM